MRIDGALPPYAHNPGGSSAFGRCEETPMELLAAAVLLIVLMPLGDLLVDGIASVITARLRHP